jgi:hypothetical protein
VRVGVASVAEALRGGGEVAPGSGESGADGVHDERRATGQTVSGESRRGREHSRRVSRRRHPALRSEDRDTWLLAE